MENFIISTDIGKDVDDAVAITYAIAAGVPIKAIITTSYDPIESAIICENILKNLKKLYPDVSNIELYYGSNKPLTMGLNDPLIYKGGFSEGAFSIECYHPVRHKFKECSIIAIGPLTNIPTVLENSEIKSIYFMAQALEEGKKLLPDTKAYNLRCDPKAAEDTFKSLDKVGSVFIGKDIAYKVPLKKQDFEDIAATRHPVGVFIKEHALMSHEKFKTKMPEIYNRIYKGTDNISYCYDPLTVLAITNPDLFTFKDFNGHKIATDIKAKEAKDILIGTIVKGLSS